MIKIMTPYRLPMGLRLGIGGSTLIKAYHSYSVTLHTRTPRFEWCVVQCGKVCLKTIGLHAQIMITILNSVLNINEGGYMSIY